LINDITNDSGFSKIVKKNTIKKFDLPSDVADADTQFMIDEIAKKLEQEIFEMIKKALIKKYKNEKVVAALSCDKNPLVLALKMKIRSIIKDNFICFIPILINIEGDDYSVEYENTFNAILIKLTNEIKLFLEKHKNLFDQADKKEEDKRATVQSVESSGMVMSYGSQIPDVVTRKAFNFGRDGLSYDQYDIFMGEDYRGVDNYVPEMYEYSFDE